MRTHDPVVGDLIEEYREVVRPSRGRFLAAVWLAAQFASFLRPWMWGVIAGLVFGLWNLIGTMISPLADDTPTVMLSLATIVLGSWVAVGFEAGRRTTRVGEAIFAGLVVATISMTLFGIANFVRVTIFLDTIKDRADWVGLIARFKASGSPDLRAFVIAEYSRSIPLSIVVMGAIGAMMGGVGGLLGRITTRRGARA